MSEGTISLPCSVCAEVAHTILDTLAASTTLSAALLTGITLLTLTASLTTILST